MRHAAPAFLPKGLLVIVKASSVLNLSPLCCLASRLEVSWRGRGGRTVDITAGHRLWMSSVPGGICQQQRLLTSEPGCIQQSKDASARKGLSPRSWRLSPLAFYKQILWSKDEITMLPENTTLGQGTRYTLQRRRREFIFLFCTGFSPAVDRCALSPSALSGINLPESDCWVQKRNETM